MLVLVTYDVSGRLNGLLHELQHKPGIDMVAPFGNSLHVSGRDETKLDEAIAPYRDKDSRVIGALGVIGPTRLNYARIVPMVDYTAQLISRMLR